MDRLFKKSSEGINSWEKYCVKKFQTAGTSQSIHLPSHFSSRQNELRQNFPYGVGRISTNKSWGIIRHTMCCIRPMSTVSLCKLCVAEGYRKWDQHHHAGPCGYRKDYT